MFWSCQLKRDPSSARYLPTSIAWSVHRGEAWNRQGTDGTFSPSGKTQRNKQYVLYVWSAWRGEKKVERTRAGFSTQQRTTGELNLGTMWGVSVSSNVVEHMNLCWFQYSWGLPNSQVSIQRYPNLFSSSIRQTTPEVISQTPPYPKAPASIHQCFPNLPMSHQWLGSWGSWRR